LLTVMPVVAIWQVFGPSRSVVAQVGIAILGMLGSSIYVTAAYHLGYPELRGPRVGMTVAGGSIITLAVLLTGNPLAAILSHAMMHVATVLHGPETTVQLPPHQETTPQYL
jgi:membrane protease YdiL (CAAX protease family)